MYPQCGHYCRRGLGLPLAIATWRLPWLWPWRPNGSSDPDIPNPAMGQSLGLGRAGRGDMQAYVLCSYTCGTLLSVPCKAPSWSQASDILPQLASISVLVAASPEQGLKGTAFNLPSARPAPRRPFQQPMKYSPLNLSKSTCRSLYSYQPS